MSVPMSAEPASAACALDELAAGFGAYPCEPGCIVRSGARGGGGSSAPGKKIMPCRALLERVEQCCTESCSPTPPGGLGALTRTGQTRAA